MATRRPDAALADLLEGAALTERRKRRGDEVEGEAVEHGVRSSGYHLTRHAHAEGGAVARAAQGGDARRVQNHMLVRAACRAHGRRTQPLRVLDRLEPHATRRRLHDD